jgi:hypothetical protein
MFSKAGPAAIWSWRQILGVQRPSAPLFGVSPSYLERFAASANAQDEPAPGEERDAAPLTAKGMSGHILQPDAHAAA